MSNATKRRNLREALSGYPLMTVQQIGAFLSATPDHVTRMLDDHAIPSIDIGRGKHKVRRADPMEVAVYFLAEQEGLTRGEYWELHGPEGTPEHCMRLLRRIRKIQGAA